MALINLLGCQPQVLPGLSQRNHQLVATRAKPSDPDSN